MITDLFIGEQISIAPIQRPIGLNPIGGDPYPTVKPGARGVVVEFIQTVINKYLIQLTKQGDDKTYPAEAPDTLEFRLKYGYNLAKVPVLTFEAGKFDGFTETLVKAFQDSFGLPKTGIVETATWDKIYALADGQAVGQIDDISSKVLSMEVSLTMDAVSQLTITVADPGLLFASANYWMLRRKINYLGLDFEIAAYSVNSGSAGEEVKIEARSYPAQRLKRDKSKAIFTGGNATAYAAAKAREVGLKFFGENVFVDKKSISQVNNGKSEESAWDVLKRLAGESQFVMFESAGWLFFASQQFLLGKFAVVDQGTTTGFFSIPVHWLTAHDDNTYTADPIPSPGAGKLTPGLKKGDKGEAVTYLQRVLQNRAGIACYYDAPEVATSDVATVLPPYVVEFGDPTYKGLDALGEFGERTERAVQRFNAIHNIGDEITKVSSVTEQTWNYVNALAQGREYQVEPYWLTALQCPECRKSDDDVNGATVSFQVERTLGKSLRPGMTIKIVDIPNFIGSYLITEVRWMEGEVGSVSVSARTPAEPKDEKLLKSLQQRIDLTGGGYSSSVIENEFGAQ